MVAPSEGLPWDLDDAIARIGRAIALVGCLLGGSLAGPAASASSTPPSALTSQNWVSAATELSDGSHPDVASVQAAIGQLNRAGRAVAALRYDVSAPAIDYLGMLESLCRPYADRTSFTRAEVQRLHSGLEQAWSRLLDGARGTATLALLAGVDPGTTPSAGAEDDPVRRITSHPASPVITGRAELMDVLEADADVEALLLDALTRTQAVFGKDASFAVEPFLDPEAPDAARRAFLVVRTTLHVEAGNRRMETLDDWWLDNSHRASGLLSIAIDYV